MGLQKLHRQLSKVDKHNYRKYDDNRELIEIVRGTSSPLDDIKKIYQNDFNTSSYYSNTKFNIFIWRSRDDID